MFIPASRVAVPFGPLVAFLLAASSHGQAAQTQFEPFIFETVEKETIVAELGTLQVPEHHANPAGNQINLAFVRVKSTAKQPGPPIVYLAGGPGGSGITLIKSLRGPVILAMREIADVIALDQRGTGLSQPDLKCSQTLDYPLDRPGEPHALLQAYEKALNDCLIHLRSNGIDPLAYNTEENSDDLESLRQALGVERISLFGSSYGSHLGLATLRRHGDKIHRAILAGVEGLDQTIKLPRNIQQQLEMVSRLAAADKVVGKRVPDLLKLVAQILAELESKPITISVEQSQGKLVNVVIGKFDMQQITAGLLGTRDGKSWVPSLYYNLSIKNYSAPAVQMAAKDIIAQRTSAIGTAMGFAMDCASGASVARRQLIREQGAESLLGIDFDFPIPQMCPDCGLRELADSFREPFKCDVPVLFVSGSFDGRTPPSNVEETIEGFSRAHHLIIEGSGHGHELFISSPKIKELELEFMSKGTVSMDRIQLPRMVFQGFADTPPNVTR